MDFDRDAWLQTVRHRCEHCGRDYVGNPLIPGEPCADDCPTNNELTRRESD